MALRGIGQAFHLIGVGSVHIALVLYKKLLVYDGLAQL
jgi:hypothetical protein